MTRYSGAEVKLAQRVVEKYNLTPPINVLELVRRYATVEFVDIPFEVDGVTQDLKMLRKKPKVFLNRSRSSTRQRFTLAHELGHILIPWHIGTIVDVTDTNPTKQVLADDYWILEEEANRFASELLMPTPWVRRLIKNHPSVEKIASKITNDADVSSPAATIKLISTLPTGYIYAQLSDDGRTIISSGRSEGTLATAPDWGTKVKPENLFPMAEEIYDFSLGQNRYLWWKLPIAVALPASKTKRRPHEILIQVLEEVGIPEHEQPKYEQTINGVIGFANSNVRTPTRSPDHIYSSCLQRFQSKPELDEIIKHPLFEEFLVKRIKAIASK